MHYDGFSIASAVSTQINLGEAALRIPWVTSKPSGSLRPILQMLAKLTRAC